MLSPDVMKQNPRRRVLQEQAFVIVRSVGGWTQMVYAEDGDPHFSEKEALALAAKVGGRVAHREVAINYELML